LTYILPLTILVYFHSNFSGGLWKTIFPQECVSAVQTNEGHWFWYQSKARMRLPISPS